MSTLTPAIDLSHHINQATQLRVPSPLKAIFKHMKTPGMISLASGLPHPSTFPFESLHVKVCAPDAKGIPGEKYTSTSSTTISVPKYPCVENEQNTLSIALQYSDATGSARLTSFMYDFTKRVMKPGYSDWQVLLHSGSTDGWSKVVSLMCEKDEYILVEEHTFSSAQAFWAPICKAAPVAIDHEGLIPEDLEDVLEHWDEKHPGSKRPHLLYTVPVGQNPTGATMGLERKKQIYDICVKHDVIICEDEPYYFLQFPRYVLPFQRCLPQPARYISEEEFVGSLVPTFLSLDYQGRVIRLETFSKTLGPGNRLGYFVCNPVFAERLLRATEVTTQTASGWSQAIVEQLIVSHWGHEGFLRWLMGLGDVYTTRRDWMCDLLSETFDLVSTGNSDELLAISKDSGKDGQKTPFFTFSPPRSGMFVYIKLHLEHTSSFKALKTEGEEDAENMWAQMFWESLIEEKVLLVPGDYYAPYIGRGQRVKPKPGVAFFRLAFCYESKEEMKLGIQRMGRVFAKYWDSEL